MSFRDYKKNRASDLEDMQKECDKAAQKTKSFEKDPDDWYPGTDKMGNGIAIIRFLPALEVEEGINFVRWWSHAFECENRWYIENCLSTFGWDDPDPVMQYNNLLWNSTEDENSPARKQSLKQGRKINHRSNILVISDSANATNNGKLKKFPYGKQFYKKIEEALQPPLIEGAIEQEQPMNPFDLFEGANLKIRMYSEKVNGKPTRKYELTWSNPGPLFAKEENIEKIYNELNSDATRWGLLKYVAPDKFKTYDVLRKRLTYVMGFDPLAAKFPLAGQEKTETKAVEKKPEFKKTPIEEDKVADEATPPKAEKSSPQKEFSADEFFNSLKDDEDDIPFK